MIILRLFGVRRGYGALITVSRCSVLWIRAVVVLFLIRYWRLLFRVWRRRILLVRIGLLMFMM